MVLNFLNMEKCIYFTSEAAKVVKVREKGFSEAKYLICTWNDIWDVSNERSGRKPS